MSTSRVIAAALLSALPLVDARAQDYPGMQFLYGTVDNDSLTAECDPPEGGSMHCSFSQVTINRGGDKDFEAELATRVAEIVKQEQERQRKDGKKACDAYATLADAVRTGKPPSGVPDINPEEFRNGMAKMGPEAKADALALTEGLAAFCQTPTPAIAESLMRTEQDKERRTCKVWTHRYEQTFTSADGGQTWISSGGPAGASLFPECGVIVVAKLQKAKDGDGHFWVYSTRKIITNKDAQTMAGACSELDEPQTIPYKMEP